MKEKSFLIAGSILSADLLNLERDVKEALDAIKDKPESDQMLILKSWNEWGEGNYMEPDLRYGRGYIKALRKAIDEYSNQ